MDLFSFLLRFVVGVMVMTVMVAADVGSAELFTPIRIPIDRCFDVQWSLPGYPTLETWDLAPPWNDVYENRDGYYTFEKKQEDGSMRFVRKRPNGTVVPIFETVEFMFISEDVLFFLGDPHDHGGFPAGGGFGTLIMAPGIPVAAAGTWITQRLEYFTGRITAEEWLIKNFHEDDMAPTTVVPTVRPEPTTTVTMIRPELLAPIRIPIDRCFDVQWSLPGYPTLEIRDLASPWNDGYEDRDGYYTFEKKWDGRMRFVRKTPNGTIVPVFEEIEFTLVSDDVLFFLGDPRQHGGFPLGGGFGTVIKAPSIPAGDAEGTWITQKLEDSGTTAEEWLTNNFYEDLGPTDEWLVSKNFYEETAPTSIAAKSGTNIGNKSGLSFLLVATMLALPIIFA